LRENHAIALQGDDCHARDVLALHVSAHDAIDPLRRRRIGSDRDRSTHTAEDEANPSHA
jgi:hypothetical protein